MNREFLEKLGLPKEQVDQIMTEHGKTVQANQAKLTTAEDKAKTLEADLAAANQLVTNLKKDNQNVEGLQAKITEYETKVAELETERTNERKSYAIKEALTQAGANDIDYMIYKLGEVELDKDGNIKDLDSKIKELKTANPTFFKVEDLEPEDKDKSKGGYKPIDNKLKGGKTTPLDIDNMTFDEINANWDAIKAQSKK